MIKLILLKGVPIYEQLQLEEALLRTTQDSWLLINRGSPPAIVMGISGKPDLLIEQSHLEQHPIPVIKRFSGGGTVVVDHNTLFVSWIMNSDALPIELYPEPILEWSTQFYKKALELEDFGRNAQDYVIGYKKCGGNAQYLKRDRWVHHTTFLWDFDEKLMSYLKYPPKTPAYREGRSHADFLICLKGYFSSLDELEKRIVDCAEEEMGSLEVIKHWGPFPEHRKSVEKVIFT